MMNNNGLYPDTAVSGKTIQSDILLGFGSLLALASTGAMVFTLQSLVNGAIPKLLACTAGIALQGCLYLFANNSHHRVRGFSLLLLALSVIMSVWFMETTWSQQQASHKQHLQVQAQNSYEAEQIRTAVTSLNRQINTLLASGQQDIDNHFRQRGLATLDHVERLKAERQTLLASLRGIQPEDNAGAVPVFESVTGLRIGLFFLIAVLIDVAAIIALKPLEHRAVRKTKPGNDGTRQRNLHNPRPDYTGQPRLVAVNDSDYQAVVKAIVDGTVPPSKNQVRKQLNIGAEKVADYFSRMVTDGVLKQDNRGWYQLALAA